MHGRSRLLLVMLLGFAGCAKDVPPPDVPVKTAPSQPGSAFDATTTGSIEGSVRWQGPTPTLPPFTVLADNENPPPDGKRLFHVANPFAPQVDAPTHGVRDAVVFLRAVDPRLACAWPHAPVRVVQSDRKIHVAQGSVASRVGIMRRGDWIEAVNADSEYHALRARGAAFFTLPFVDAGKISRRQLDRAGIVELTSAASYFWMCAHLLVVEHPYYARTDAKGRFRLEQVPAGRYEAVCWMPSWVVTRKERDPESGLISRLIFGPALEQAATVVVRAGAANRLEFAWCNRDADAARK